MTARGVPTRGVRAAFAAALAIGLPGLGACATPFNPDMPAKPQAAELQIDELARRAHKGDRSARLELGLRLQEGRGVPRDPEQACALFDIRPRKRNREVWLYTPSTRSVQRYERAAAPKRPVDEELEYRAFLCRQGTQAPAARR